MLRANHVVLAITFGSCLALRADDPKSKADLKPQWQRMLTGDDAKKANELEDRIEADQEADRYQNAIASAQEILDLQIRVQGADHWQVAVAKSRLEELKKIAALPAEKRAGWRKSALKTSESGGLKNRAELTRELALRQERLKWCRELLGDGDPVTAGALTNTATILSDLKRHAEAGGLLKEALDIWRAAYGELHPTTALGYHNLATNLSEEGKRAEAIPLLRKALEIRIKILGPEDARTATTHNNLGLSLKDLGQMSDAIPHLQAGLDIRVKVLGRNNALTATSFNNLAITYSALGRYADAEPLLRTALDIRIKLNGEEHTTTARGYGNLASNVEAQGKYEEAEPLHRKSLSIRVKNLGEDHPDTAIAYNNLAFNLAGQGKPAAASPLYRKALEIWLISLGEDHPDTTAGFMNVAANLSDQHKHAEAEPIYRKALALRINTFGENHPETADCYGNLAGNLDAQKKSDEAERLFRKAQAIYLLAPSDAPLDTARAYANVAGNLETQNKYAQAAPYFKKALDAYLAAVGERHPRTAGIYHNLANNLAAQGNDADATPLFERALNLRIELLGTRHPETTNAYASLAHNLAARKKDADALIAIREAVKGYEAARLTFTSRVIDRALYGDDSSPYCLLAALEARAGRFGPAWDALEMDLARATLDEATKGLVGEGLTRDEQTKRDALRDRLAKIEPQILRLTTRKEPTPANRQALDSLVADRRALERQLSDIAVTVSQRLVAGLAPIQASLPADTALVAWVDVVTDGDGLQEHWGCIVRPTGAPIWERLPGSGPDQKWVKNDKDLPDRLRKGLAGSREVASLAKLAYEQRLAPLERHLGGVKRLVVVPVEKMAGIPVEVLTDKYTISYVPSGSYLARLKDRARPTGPNTILALGDPVFDVAGRPTPTAVELPPGGLLITQVVAGGAAATARLRPGDVLLKYAGTELKSADDLGKLIAEHVTDKSVSVTVWRVGQKDPAVRDVASGKLGIVLAKEPAPEAVANRRKTDALIAAASRGRDWSDLPGTRIEVARLATLFGDAATTLTDSAASDRQLDALRAAGKLKDFRYLHLATHGENDNVRAFESALILSQDNRSDPTKLKAGETDFDGRLTANEVLDNWKLDADLVTLSACETGLGRFGGGDGLLGFAQAFLLAGSRSVCLSLWKVDDAATALLMDRFYRNLLGKRTGLDKPLPKAEALAEAKKWLRELTGDEALKITAELTQGVARGNRGKEKAIPLLSSVPEASATDAKAFRPYTHPRYWAAFILIGDPG